MYFYFRFVKFNFVVNIYVHFDHWILVNNALVSWEIYEWILINYLKCLKLRFWTMTYDRFTKGIAMICWL